MESRRLSGITSRKQVALDAGGLILQDGQGQAIVVAGLGIADLRLSLLKLGLAQFNDGAQSHGVTCLGEIESKVGLSEQLLSHGNALESRVGIQPTGTNVPGNPVAEIEQAVLGGLSF